jgi:RNA polymerase sigma factor (sigma-70 family)
MKTFYETRLRTSSSKKVDNHGRLLTAYFQEVAQLDIPSPAQERELFTAYRDTADEEQRKKLKGNIAKGYLRFVIKQAMHRTHDESLLLDLINAGNEGLLVAIDKFDIDKGNRFLTYGAWWIRVYIQTAMRESGLGRHGHSTLQTDDEDDHHRPPVRMQYLPNTSLLPSDTPTAEILLGQARFNAMRELGHAALSRRETLILVYYFGLRGGQRLTFSQLAHLLHELDGRYISSERVRQLKEHAVRRLQRNFSDLNLFSAGDVL